MANPQTSWPRAAPPPVPAPPPPAEPSLPAPPPRPPGPGLPGTDPLLDGLLDRAAQSIVEGELSLELLRDTEALEAFCAQKVRQAAAQESGGVLWLTPDKQALAARRLHARLTGLDFLDDLISSGQYTDIKINADGRVWTRSKGSVTFAAQQDLRPDAVTVARMANTLLAPVMKACTEANPSVDAKMPRDGKYGGARIKVLHPVICSGRCHYINIRLFEPRPVQPQQIADWNMCPQPVLDRLLQAVAENRRLLIAGGTGTGKTTLLCALLTALPTTAALVKIEDPEEIWLAHPDVVTLERRLTPAGSEVPDYDTHHAVDDAMRMSPSHVVVGESRNGQTVLALLRALMSDHSGGTTFHAASPGEVLNRMALTMYADCGVALQAGRMMLLGALDLIVQVGIRHGVRRVLGVYELRDPLEKNRGQGDFTPLWVQGEDPDGMAPFRRHKPS